MASNENGIDVLVVEDNPNDAELTLRALKGVVSPDRLRHVEDGVKALEVLLGGSGHGVAKVVLLDLKLPKVDGLEVLRRVKQEERTRSLPVVVLTSSKEERDIADSYQLGANGYLVKPVGFEEYVSLVRLACRYWCEINQPAPARA